MLHRAPWRAFLAAPHLGYTGRGKALNMHRRLFQVTAQGQVSGNAIERGMRQLVSSEETGWGCTAARDPFKGKTSIRSLIWHEIIENMSAGLIEEEKKRFFAREWRNERNSASSCPDLPFWVWTGGASGTQLPSRDVHSVAHTSANTWVSVNPLKGIFVIIWLLRVWNTRFLWLIISLRPWAKNQF